MHGRSNIGRWLGYTFPTDVHKQGRIYTRRGVHLGGAGGINSPRTCYHRHQKLSKCTKFHPEFQQTVRRNVFKS